MDPEITVDVYVLQAIFCPRINHCLTEFACAWNHHPLRTERNWTPKKIWLNGVLDPGNEDLTAIRDIFDPVPPGGLDSFGIDPEGPLPSDLDESLCSTVTVHTAECPLSAADSALFFDRFNPLSQCNDYGIALYSAAKNFVYSCL